MNRKLATGLTALAATAATLALAGPASAAQAQTVRYTGPGMVVLHNASPVQTYAVTGSGAETGNAATITSLSPAVCTVAPTGAGKANVTFTSGGNCVLRYQAAGNGSYDPLDTTRAIYVWRLGF